MFSIYTTPSFYAPVAPQPTFTTLFRLLDDFDSCAREVQHCQPRQRRHRPMQIFKPPFDVRETEAGYELHGDLPGVERQHLNIEFTGPQTLVVKGRVVRTYETKQPQQTKSQNSQEEPASAKTQPTEAAEAEPEKKDEFVVVNNHHATVEDDPEDNETSSTLSAGSAEPVPTPAETPRTEAAAAAPAEVEKAPTAATTNEKVQVYERTIGEFSRTFNFPDRVDQEGVTATLDNGVLSIAVPKAKTPVTRRIAIN